MNLNKIEKAHFIGISSPFSTFCAQYLIHKGIQITASEINQNNKNAKYWRKKGILYKPGHSKKYITPDINVVITPNGPIPKNPEIVQAKQLNIKTITIGKLTGIISKKFKTIAIAGTHGKTTTTSLIVWILHKNLKVTPNFIVGDSQDMVKGLNKNYNFNPKSPYLVLEACEYKKQFLDRAPKPYIAVITNIDIDHTDFYKTQEDYNKAFWEFLKNAKNIVINPKGVNEKAILRKLKTKEIIDVTKIRFSQKIKIQKKILPGSHNTENLKRAIAVGVFLKLKKRALIDSLNSFKGVTKRLEFITKTKKGSLIYKDYAHNPKKIESLIKGVKELYPNKEILLVYQPHSYERTYTFKKEFTKALSKANKIILTTIYAPLRELNKYRHLINSKEFKNEVKNINPNTVYMPKLDKIQNYIAKQDTGNQIIIFASAGDMLSKLFTKKSFRKS